MSAPVPWFLPGPIRIRGGLARHFASAWLFHRGIHFEASLVGGQNKVTQLQRVGPDNRWPEGGFYYFSQESGGFCEARHDIGQGRDVTGASPKLD